MKRNGSFLPSCCEGLVARALPRPPWPGHLLLAAVGLVVSSTLAAPVHAAAAGASPGVGSAVAGNELMELATVRYRSRSNVYLDRGAAAGLYVGQQLVIVRDGRKIGTIAIVFVARHSATAVVVEASAPVAARDLVVPPSRVAETLEQLARTARDGARVDAAAAATVHAPPARLYTRSAAGGRIGLLRPAADRSVAAATSQTRFALARPSRTLWLRSSGTVSVAWEGVNDGRAAARDSNEATGRISLSLRDIGGEPYDLRVRMRARQVTRSNVTHPEIVDSESRNRLYELSLRYDPPDGRFQYVIGRVGVSPFVSVGYLDGALAKLRLSDTFQVGAFGGSVPSVDGLRFAFNADKYGAFLHYGRARSRRPGRFDLVVAGIRERYDIRSRDYLSFETSFASERWSLFQRLEFDTSLPSRGGADRGSGLSAASVSASYRLGARSRVYANFHARRDTFPGALRLNTDLFEDRFRRSVRAGLSVSTSRTLTLNVGGGVRFEQGSRRPTLSGNVGVLVRTWKMWTAGSLLVYDGERDTGFIANLRVTATIARGVRVSGLYTHYYARDARSDITRSNDRFDGSLWLDLTGGLFLQAGVESSSGRDLAGTRLFGEAGFRF